MAHRRPLMAHSMPLLVVLECLPMAYSVTQGRTLDATSIQSATDGSIPYAPVSSIQYATGNDISLATQASQQRRALQFLIANRDSSDPSQTVVIGYHAISTYCFQPEWVTKSHRGALQKGSHQTHRNTARRDARLDLYSESSIQYATNSSILYPAGGH